MCILALLILLLIIIFVHPSQYTFAPQYKIDSYSTVVCFICTSLIATNWSQVAYHLFNSRP